MRLTVSELHQRGVDAANSRRFAAARRALTAGAARTDDPDLRARIDGTRAYVLAQTGEPADAEVLCRETLARTGLRPETVAVLSGQLGVLLTHAGRLDEAEDMLTRAIEAMAPESTERANALMNRSVVRMQRHALSAAVSDLEQASAIYETQHDEESRAEAQHNLGYAALLGGDLVRALALMTRSRPTFAATSELATAISDLDRAEVLRDAGLTTEAEALLTSVAAQFGAQRMRQARGEAELHLARSLVRHDAAGAERAANTAVRRFRALASDGWAARAEAVRLEARLQARPHTPPPPSEFAAAAAQLDRGGFRTEAIGLRLSAQLAGATGRMPRVAADAPTPLRLRVREVRAEQAARAGKDAAARRIAGEGLDLLASWQESFGALDLLASLAMHGSGLVYAGLSAASRSDDPAILFEWSERARHLSQQVAPVRPPHDPELAADLAELRMLRADLAGHDWTTDARVRTLHDRIRERQWTATTASGTRGRVDLAETQRELDDDTAVLAYVYTGSALRCVAVTRRTATIADVSWPRVQAALEGLRADLDVAALTRNGPLADIVGRSLTDRLRRLDDELLGPVSEAASGRRLVITVPGVLGGIPWAMLPGMTGVPFTLATSVSRWLPERTTPRVLATAGFAAGPRVPRAADEVRSAAASWVGGRVLLGEEARVAAVTDLAGSVDVLHIAAHGRHAVDNPLFSGFELADGTLFGHDVDLIPRAPDTVILSACELGRSSIRWGEEALGMTRVWLHAGTRCVIAAPVVVPDDVASELLAAVHSGLRAGDPPAVALAAASESTGHRAPFQCHGSGF